MATDIWINTSQRLHALLDRAASSSYQLTLAELHFPDLLALSSCRVDCHVSTETLKQTQLIRLTAAVLRLAVLQQQLNNVGWDSADYCLMVMTAAGMLVVAGTGFQRSDASFLAFAAQVHSSKLVPDLSTALSTLAQIVDAAGGCEPAVLANAADSLLAVAYNLLDLWPGNFGALVSATAGPLVQPTLQLTAARVRNALKAPPIDFWMLLDMYIKLLDRLGYQMASQMKREAKQPLEQRQQEQQRHPYSSQLRKSPDFLQLQLFLIALRLQPCFLRKVCRHSSVVTPGNAGDSVPAHGGTADATAAAASSSSAGPAQQVRDIQQSSQAVAGSPAAPLTDLQAAQCQQQILLLQALYPGTRDITSWNQLLAAATQAELGDCCLDPLGLLINNVAAIAVSVRHFMHDSLNAVAGPRSPGANDSSNEQSLASVHLNNLKALQVLPVLLLRSLQYVAPPEASAAVFRHLCVAVGRLLDSVTACWSCQAVCHRRGHAAGVDIQQLPLAELLDLLLQLVKPQLRHMAAPGADGEPPAVPVCTAEATIICSVSPDVTTVRGVGGSSSSSGSDSSMQDKHTGAATAPETAAAAAAANSVAAAGSATLAAADDDADASIKHLLLMAGDVICVFDTSAQALGMLQPSVMQLTAVVEQYIRNSSRSSSRLSSSVDIELVQLCMFLLAPLLRSTPHPPDRKGLLVLSAAAAEPDSDQQHRLLALLISLTKDASNLSTLPSNSGWYIGLELQLLQAVALAASNMLDTSTSSGDVVVGTSYSLGNAAAAMSATAPWLVAAARVLINTAGILGRVLGCEELLLDVPDHVTAGSSHRRIKYHEAWQVVQVVTRDVAYVVATDIGCCCRAADGPGSTSSSSNLSDHTAASAGAAAATEHAITDAVHQLQMTELAAAAEQLGAVCQQLRSLYDACFGSGREAVDTAQRSEMRPADLEPAVAAAAQASTMSTCDTPQVGHTLQQLGVQSLQQALCEVGQRVCAALPLGSCCNNPSCSSMKDDSELTPVNGKSCVCAGCEVDRYCCMDCQAAHWQQHKPICKLIKRQNRAKQQQQQAV